uniref:Beta-1,3-galactosyl-O-glycosyl-glycoprotein beta-1,6-N-acetylglucosaminyltransferase n=1 Tax=Schistocephalus solidus TaxID=70667 RepID=A0A0X3NXN1_SCHSO
MKFLRSTKIIIFLGVLLMVGYKLNGWFTGKTFSFSQNLLANRCKILFSDGMTKNHGVSKRLTPLHTQEYLLRLNEHFGEYCQDFKQRLFPREVPISEEERDFPLAFLLTVFKDINQVARLLRLIYRPHNFYVIHVDKKSPITFYKAVQEIAKCFGDNVDVVPQSESIEVKWGDYTVLEQELVAAQLLLTMGKWKYLINLTGQELPLKTNLELVQALRMLNGSNIVDVTLERRNKLRIPNANLSFPVIWLKSAVHMVAKQEFINYMLNDARAIEVREAIRQFAYKGHGSEQLYGTLAYNPHMGAPGACLKIHEETDKNVDKMRLANIIRYKLWYPEPCATHYVRSICILGSQHLPALIRSHKLFANKFHEDYFPEGYDCLEYAIAERTYKGPAPGFDPSVFANLYCSSEHI